jgi:hypothetical protein
MLVQDVLAEHVAKAQFGETELEELVGVLLRDELWARFSWMKQAGQDSMVVARLLGHTTSQMVDRVYGHRGAHDFRRAIDDLPGVDFGEDVSPGDLRVSSGR